MKSAISLILTVLATFITFGGAPDIFYYVNDDDDTLWQLNVSTGVSTEVGTISVSGIEAIAFWPIPGNNVLYAADGGDLGTLNTSDATYTLISEIDGGGTLSGDLGDITITDVDGLSFDPFTGILWASERRATSGDYDVIFQIDVSTGQYIPNAFGPGVDYIVIDGEGIYDDVDDIAISSSSGLMFAISNNGSTDQLININKFTGAITVIGNLTFIDIEGLAFANNGNLYGSRGGAHDPNFYQVDPSDASMTGGVTLGDNGGSPDTESLAALVADANTISGTLFNDQNLNGIRDGEPGLANVTINVYLDNNSSGDLDGNDNLLQRVTTNSLGQFTIYIATTAEVLITVDDSTLPINYTLTTTNLQVATFTDNVNFGEIDVSNNFGAGASTDTDGDGIMDFTEGIGDSDGDGVLDRNDLDSDNDGLLDSDEGTEDLDFDGIPKYLDLDSDNDGIPDAIEANQGIEPTGYSSSSATIAGSVGSNGIPDVVETAVDSGLSILSNNDQDKDGVQDYWDPDSDNDGILDVIEAGGDDANGDGILDSFVDTNSDGLSDAILFNPPAILNTDQAYEIANALTQLPNYIDQDSDNDGIDDTNEGYSTSQTDRPELITDADDDGIIDFWDVSLGGSPIVPVDTDTDGTDDYYDTDSDQDTIIDLIEANDTNSDGTEDVAITGSDDNGNGIDNAFDNNCSSAGSFSLVSSSYGEEESSTGNMDIGSSDIELPYDAGDNQIIGIKFSGIDIPNGADVVSSYIQFEVDENTHSGTVILDIFGELTTNAEDYSVTNGDVSDRNPTSANQTWTINTSWGTVGEAGVNQRTPDLSLILEEIVGQGPWVSGNDIGFIIQRNSGDASINRRTVENDPVLVVIYEGGVSYGCATNVNLQDTDSDLEVDFRDNDDDEDGILTANEPSDAGSNGIADYLEVNTSCDPSGPTISGNADAVTFTFNEDSGEPGSNVLGIADGVGARMENDSDAILVLDMTDEVRQGEDVTVRLRSSGTLDADIRVQFSRDDVSYGTPIDLNFDNDGVYTDYNFTVNIFPGARYIKLTEILSTGVTLRIDAISYSFSDCAADTDLDGVLDSSDGDSDNDGITDAIEGTADTDGDGVTDDLDLDSDNDGIPDAVEANGGVLPANMTADGQFNIPYAQSNDSDSDGIINDVDGSPLSNPDTDGDGLDDRIDVDSDGDGIPDVVEAGGSDSNGDGVSDSSTDQDSDGLIDIYDASAFGSALNITSSDGDSFPDYLDIDSDNDGIPDHREGQSSAGYTLSANADTDGDGLDDNFDSDNGGVATGTFDIDSDGIPDYLDNDSDNDGVPDLIEGNDANADGVTDVNVSGIDADNDGLDDNFDNLAGPTVGNEAGSNIALQNTDGDAQSDFRDADDDADGLLTSNEDFNGNLDYADDLTQGGSPVPDYIFLADTDGDGVDNDTDQDIDNDGITDTNEGGGTNPNADTDSDGIPNYADPDVGGFVDGNSDGINDNFDQDQDGIPNHFDLDADNDGVPDAVEANGGTLPTGANDDGEYPAATVSLNDNDTDGLIDTYDADFNTELINLDSDGDGVANSSDLDSDNDGLPDALENGGGTLPVNMNANGQYPSAYFTTNDGDNDGIANDVDPDNGGVALMLRSSDEDGLHDAYDRDSDNDGLTDAFEANGSDANYDGILDSFVDTNGNGLNDAVDIDASGTALILVFTDFDSFPDHLDIDSDNDGIVDNIEGQPTSGYRAPQDSDSDSDGLDDEYDPDIGTVISIQNTDGDGSNDYQDLDSDNDGVFDSIEGSDDDNDGINDFVENFDDTDNDGLSDRFDNVSGPAIGNSIGSMAIIQNSDTDAVFDWRDSDDDGDGIPTLNEDNNSNGNWADDFTQGGTSPDYLHVDTDFDGDGVLDSSDPDSDNDGVPDSNEGFGEDPSADTDIDGVPNYLDTDFVHGTLGAFVDSNGDGINDLFDSDMDGIPNHKDRDSDNDGITDLLEAGGVDSDNNGIADDLTDTDADGIVDLFDGTPLTLPDTDGDGLVDIFDADSDGDGVVDLIENGQLDSDGNGRLDGYRDIDGDGYDDRYNPDSGGSPVSINDTDSDGIEDYQDIDSDNDGITDNIESQTSAGFTVEAGADADRDGIDDNYDSDTGGTPISEVDTDGDGFPDFQDTDSDGDTVPDVIEGSDANSDGQADWDISDDDIFDLAEGNFDTDNDGFLDAFDSDNGGTIPGLQNTDGTGDDDYRDPDDDNDTIATSDESTDADTNGIDDYLETDTPAAGDTDGDGIADGIDTDDDNDGIPDATEGTGDTDEDGITNDLDLDSDNDGIVDAIEANGGTLPDNMNPQGRYFISYAQANDADNDGLIDDVDGTPLADPDFDLDGIEDRLDRDTDNDGIPDIIEAGGSDTDGDGEVDNTADTNGNGIADIVDFSNNPGGQLTPGDKDGDGDENYIDLDSDGDTIFDLIEELRSPDNVDADVNGMVDGSTDADNDGVLDVVDPDEGGFASLPDDFDGDGLADYLDLDSDGDGLPDETEGTVDSDSDGLENYIDIDSDGDGITDNQESQASSSYLAPNLNDTDNDGLDNRYDIDNGGTAIAIVNTDGDAFDDYLDTDSDNDGVPDAIEGNDGNQDGVADNAPVGSDLDQDGLDDSFDIITSGTSGNATGSNAAIINTDGAGLRNWQDTDDDGDGLLTANEDDNTNGDWSDDFTQGQGNGTFPDYLYNESTSPLPVELIQFNAEYDRDESVRISWSTASEINNDFFVLMRSFGGAWTVIDKVKGSGNSNSMTIYGTIDKDLTGGIRYYQLVQYDYNGDSEFSEIITLDMPFDNLIFSAYPNPTAHYLTLSHSSNGRVKYRMVDLNGKHVKKGTFKESVTIDISEVEKGLYLIYLENASEIMSTKVFVK